MTTARARRPRVEGPREREIFDATMSLLGEVGYDRLTLDTVAARVKVSKATIYRRWGDKSDLVNAAMECQDETELTLPDTGSVSAMVPSSNTVRSSGQCTVASSTVSPSSAN